MAWSWSSLCVVVHVRPSCYSIDLNGPKDVKWLFREYSKTSNHSLEWITLQFDERISFDYFVSNAKRKLAQIEMLNDYSFIYQIG